MLANNDGAKVSRKAMLLYNAMAINRRYVRN
jgi:hypothetical protein